MKIGIIGAGAAGLTAAYELGKNGHEVEVFDRAPFVGGQASTFDLNGSKLERGIDKDYTINYNAGEIIFNTTMPITSDMRININYCSFLIFCHMRTYYLRCKKCSF